MSHGASLKRSVDAKGSTKGASRSTFSAAPVGQTQANADPLDPSQLDLSVIGWSNIEMKFNELKGMLSAPASGLNANQARAQQKKRVSAAIVQLLDRAQQDCRRLLIEGNAKAAVEAGLKTLHLKEAYYGHGHLQLVPAYFHLARTNQYMDKFKAAEEFLSLAQWTILRNKDAVDASLKAELHQTFGLLYASDSKLDAALKQLTCATYYLCVMNGPEHILTSFGYFDLGNVFAAKSNMEHAMAFYDKVKDIWYTHLTTALRKALEPENTATQYGGASEGENAPSNDLFVASSFGVENLQDAVKMLRGIVGLQTERYGRVHPSTARAEFVLGMFMLWNGDPVAAVASLLKALEISKRVFGARHPNTGEIRSLMLNFGLEVPEDTTNVLDDDVEPRSPERITAKQPPPPEPVLELQAQPDEPTEEPNTAAEEPSEVDPTSAAQPSAAEQETAENQEGEEEPATQGSPSENVENSTAAEDVAQEGDATENKPAAEEPEVVNDAAEENAEPEAQTTEEKVQDSTPAAVEDEGEKPPAEEAPATTDVEAPETTVETPAAEPTDEANNVAPPAEDAPQAEAEEVAEPPAEASPEGEATDA